MKTLLSIFFCLSIFTIRGQEVKFLETSESWESVIQQAKASQKPIFVDIYTEWCGPCKWMDQNVFNQKETGEFMNKEFLNVKVDAEKSWGVAFKNKYGVNAYPTYMFFSPDGDVVFSSGGSKPSDFFISEANYALQNWKKGISYEGLQKLTESESFDMNIAKEYLLRLAGNKPTTSILLNQYLLLLPEDKLYENSTLDLIKQNLSSPLNREGKAFQVLLHHYHTLPIRNMNMNSTWQKLKKLIDDSIDSTSAQANNQLLKDILELQSEMYPAYWAETNKYFYLARYHAVQNDEEAFINSFQEFLNLYYKPEEFQEIIDRDYEDFMNTIRLESDIAYPSKLKDSQMNSLRTAHIGYIRQNNDQLTELIIRFKVGFPHAFIQMNKDLIDKTLQFSLQLNIHNRVAVNDNRNNKTKNFIETYKIFKEPI